LEIKTLINHKSYKGYTSRIFKEPSRFNNEMWNLAGEWGEAGGRIKRGTRTLRRGVIEMLTTFIEAMVLQVYTGVKTYQIIHFKDV
jgi:hypothetical protein